VSRTKKSVSGGVFVRREENNVRPCGNFIPP
jgi:hypothetical protein